MIAYRRTPAEKIYAALHRYNLGEIDLPPGAEASENIVLTERENGIIIAVETEHKDGFALLKEEYTDLLSEERECDQHLYSHTPSMPKSHFPNLRWMSRTNTKLNFI